MHPLITLAMILAALVLVDLAALRWGVDSRRTEGHRGDWS
jgi:hypothetical protein